LNESAIKAVAFMPVIDSPIVVMSSRPTSATLVSTFVAALRERWRTSSQGQRDSDSSDEGGFVRHGRAPRFLSLLFVVRYILPSEGTRRLLPPKLGNSRAILKGLQALDLASLRGVPKKAAGEAAEAESELAFSRTHNGRAAASPTVQRV
jgi:hypothetical protein